MEALSALLEPVSRMLVAGFGAAPLAWVVGVLVLLLALAATLLRRRGPVAARRGAASLPRLGRSDPQSPRDQRDRCIRPAGRSGR